MQVKRSVLIFVDWFVPAFKAGGPIQSVFSIAVNLAQNGAKVLVVCGDRDLGDSQAMPGIQLNAKVPMQGFQVLYLPPESCTQQMFRELIAAEDPDIIYFNSLFSQEFTLKPLMAAKKLKRSVIIAPRGMLGKGALQIKPGKKRLFLGLARVMGLFKLVRWHASSDYERQEILDVFPNATVHVALNLPSVHVDLITDIKKPPIEKEVRLLFVSRISVKKNLEFLIDCLDGITFSTRTKFDIVGAIDDEEYWKSCQVALAKLKNQVEVTFRGPMAPGKVAEVMASSHFLLLPTAHENYGHVIIEAMTVGCVPVISPNTPWVDLEERQAGWVRSIEQADHWLDVLQHLQTMLPSQFEARSLNAIEYAQRVKQRPQVLRDNLELFGIISERN